MTKVIKPYRTYKFCGKDPVIDRLHTAVDDAGVSLTKIGKVSGVSRSTIYNWFDGPTRRPQYATVVAVARAIGYDFQMVKTEDEKKPERQARKEGMKVYTIHPM